MRRSIIFIASVVVLAFAAAALPAQSLLDNEYYQKAQALKAQSDAALAAGDYDAATALAAEAKAELAKSDAYVEDMLGRYRANGWLQRAAERLAEAKSAGDTGYAKEPYDEASGDLDMAWAAYDGAAYEDSIDFAKRTIDTLDAIPAPQAVAVVKPVVEPVVETVTVQTESLTLPGRLHGPAAPAAARLPLAHRGVPVRVQQSVEVEGAVGGQPRHPARPEQP